MTGATPSGPASSGLAMGAERAAQIAEMESMGFERSQIDLAMRAAFYNSERAIEYLLTVSGMALDLTYVLTGFLRVSPTMSNRNNDKQLQRLLLKPKISRFRQQEEKAVMRVSTFSRPQPRLVLADVARVLALALVEIHLQVQVQVRVLEVQLVSETSTFYEITLNFSNCDRLYSKTHKCSSPFFSRLARATHNWQL